MHTRAVEDLERCPLEVLHRRALELQDAFKHHLHACRHPDRASAPRIRIAWCVRNVTFSAGEAPRERPHAVGADEYPLERAALLDARALGLGKPLETASERELGVQLRTPVHIG